MTASVLRNQWSVLSGLLLLGADSKRGRSFRFGFLLAMGEPLIIIGAICLLFYVINRPPIYGDSMVLFVATGVFPVYIFIHTCTRMRESMIIGKSNRYPAERTLDHVAIDALLHGLGSVTMAFLFFTALVYSGERAAVPFDPGGAVVSLFLVYVFGIGMGILNTVIGRLVPVWDSIWPAIVRASIHFSGMYYVVDYLPPPVRYWFGINPVLSGVEWFRHCFYPFYPSVVLNKNYIELAAVTALFLGLIAEWIFRDSLEEK